ncbi:MAG: hypothetical protein Q4E01_00230 [Actinomycetaceae bacterium]|nr:hypothetical protein [Actinomycetaceae bacterium]
MQIQKAEKHGATIEASSVGATLRSWQVNGVEIVDGYKTDAEQETLNGFRNAILAPWSNRIEGGTWQDGNETRMIPKHSDEIERGLHGLFYARDFDHEESAGELHYTSSISASEHWPADTQLEVTYSIKSETTLRIEMRCTNLGERAVPVGLGWHPYFLLDGPLEEARLDIKASHWVSVDDALIPLPADEAFRPADTSEPIQFPPTLDEALTGIEAGEDGWVSARLITGAREVIVRSKLDPQVGFANFHLFSGRGLARDAGKAVAVEPCQYMPNALNRPEIASNMMLEPGETREQVIEVEVKL